MRIARIALVSLACTLALLALAWGTAAIWIDGPATRWLAGVLAATFALAELSVLLMVRPAHRSALAFAVLFGVVLLWWMSIAPRNDRNWMPDVNRLASARLEGNRLIITNVRNFQYRSDTDFIQNWETRTYDLSHLRGVDMFLSFWGPTAIAHTIASWDFGDGQHLAISIETRKEKGETYSALLGFFRQYELYYVVADERDVIGVRTNQRGEHAYLYRIRLPADRARAVLLDYLAEVNALSTESRWYNAATQNCTTTIREHVRHVMPGQPWSWKILANGYIDELWYERGIIDNTLPFAEMKERSNVTERAKEAGSSPEFSERIREGLPERGN